MGWQHPLSGSLVDAVEEHELQYLRRGQEVDPD